MDRIEMAMLSLVGGQLFGNMPERAAIAEVIGDGREELYRVAKNHDLAHLVGAALESLGLLSDDEISKKFRKQHYAAIFRYRGFEYELSRVSTLFCAEGIKHIPLKGSVLRGYYPEPWMRTSCDIDVLVPEDELERAGALLAERLEYKLAEKGFHDVSFFSQGGVNLELHFDLIEGRTYPEIEKVLSGVWECALAKDGSCAYAMPDEVFYFYHVAHMLKHFLHGGCGIRSFADLLILDRMGEGSKEARDKLLADAGILEFAEKSRRLARIWFEGEESDEFYDEFGHFVFDGGIYGKVETKVLVAHKRKGGKFSYALARIFLPYKALKELFPVLKKHKWLTPVFEVVRWFKIIFGGRLGSSVKELKTNATLSTEDERRAEIILDNLGLSNK